MTMTGWSPVLGLALFATVLSGCLSEGELTVDGLEAPVWEPGFRWSYDVDSVGSNAFLTDGGRASSTFEYATTLNSTVINTSGTVDGAPAYFVSQDTEMENHLYGMELGLFGQGGVVALTQDTLQPVARSDYWGWRAECMPVELYPVEEPSLLQFPLNLGKTWAGDMDHVTYTAEVVGVETVDTGAGAFDAIHVRIVLTPEQDQPETMPVDADMEYPAEDYDERETIEEAVFTQDYWYAPLARNVVKTVTTGHTVYTEDEDRYEMTTSTTILLSDYALMPGEQQPAPPVRTETFRHYGMQVTSDTAFPVNVANGTVTARFGIQERAPPEPRVIEVGDRSSGVHVIEASMPYAYGEIAFVDAVPDVAAYDHDQYELVWSIRTWDGERDEHVGDVLELEIDAPDIVSVDVHLRPVPVETEDEECGMYRMHGWGSLAHGQVNSYFEKEYTIHVDAGPAHEVDLGAIPVGLTSGWLTGTWTVDSAVMGVEDAAYPVLYTPDGNRQSSADAAAGYVEGWTDPSLGAEGWRLAWKAYGPDVTAPDTPVVVGHDAVLNLRIDPQ